MNIIQRIKCFARRLLWVALIAACCGALGGAVDAIISAIVAPEPGPDELGSARAAVLRATFDMYEELLTIGALATFFVLGFLLIRNKYSTMWIWGAVVLGGYVATEVGEPIFYELMIRQIPP